jgi:hypothetical protein
VGSSEIWTILHVNFCGTAVLCRAARPTARYNSHSPHSQLRLRAITPKISMLTFDQPLSDGSHPINLRSQ